LKKIEVSKMQERLEWDPEEEVRAALESLFQHIKKVARDSWKESIEQAKRDGYDKEIRKVQKHLKEDIQILEKITKTLEKTTKGIVNPVKSNCLTALCGLKYALRPINEVVSKMEEMEKK